MDIITFGEYIGESKSAKTTDRSAFQKMIVLELEQEIEKLERDKKQAAALRTEPQLAPEQLQPSEFS